MSDESDRFLSPRDIAGRLSVSEVTVRRMISSGRLPSVRPTERLVRVPESAVNELLRSSVKASRS